MPYIYPI
jgi:hypothetical protein